MSSYDPYGQQGQPWGQYGDQPGAHGPPGGQQSGPYGQPYGQYGYGYTPGAPQLRVAGFWIRFAASLVDGLLIGVPFAIIGIIVAADDAVIGTGLSATYSIGLGGHLGLTLLEYAVEAAYYGGTIGSASGQSLGKKLCGIRVVDSQTGRPGIGFPRGLGRWAMSLVSSLPCGLGYLWMLWDDQKQTWHDKVARTQVIHV